MDQNATNKRMNASRNRPSDSLRSATSTPGRVILNVHRETQRELVPAHVSAPPFDDGVRRAESWAADLDCGNTTIDNCWMMLGGFVSRFARIFTVWFLAIMAIWGFANLPRDGGTLKSFLEWAGFPWTFAHWVHGRLEWFSATALILDILVGVLIGSAVGLACACTRCTWRTQSALGKPDAPPTETCGPRDPDEPDDAREWPIASDLDG